MFYIFIIYIVLRQILSTIYQCNRCFFLKNVPEQWAVMSLAPQDSALLCQPFIHGQ
ncbi:hypothetical protein EcE24377A_4642 [Escherichia coli O139:H28 str. E24377A]|uniref:Uncharacterized protein n=2 Tax=Escherichia coli TaxID=562 RepID=A7ZUW0_ECO24|nr:hypothetical protein EcHS_A4330 [Escherichia coli HS]ABV17291.1 hypothetical protein EcE24377A_4642 [Escherichia coli O139:H28 str. E24377A]EFZ67605.1 hypothetical protein ECOK1357_4492 [Escherichia coli OK1357]EGW64451.1 hypothetical protein ECSTECB2F1_4498 [Escherichia coli O91:H21 str. B2F1]EHX68045.1 ribose 5-phosphate isomerase B [Escherichia coli DEC13E]EHY01526.1 ribose 5-phosphate isomerase B [Escherichia coli DEC15C]EMV16516.1 putative ribose-5-phosphate isomerase B [Escherichia c